MILKKSAILKKTIFWLVSLNMCIICSLWTGLLTWSLHVVIAHEEFCVCGIAMSEEEIEIPQGYEILKTIDVSDLVAEYVARHTDDDALVRLKVFNFTQTSTATTRRHLREYLRCDITFMEELELAGVLRIFDYSDAKKSFWVATQPAELDRLSERFDFLASQSLQFRQSLVNQFLFILQQIHKGRVVHRNLSSEAVYLSSEQEIFIGEFGFATFLSDQPAIRQATTYVTTAGYLPPEVSHAATFSCDVSCDIFSAGLLVFEILSAVQLPKDNPAEIHGLLRMQLNERIAEGVIDAEVAEVILKAADPIPESRWASAEVFAKALEKLPHAEPGYSPMQFGQTSTVAITQPADSTQTIPLKPRAEATPEISQEVPAPAETAEKIIPLDPEHEIWNNRYEILDKIGEGGQAIVYRAFDHLTDEEIAIKTIWSRHRGDRAAINRLKQGAMVARSLTHRYIIKTYSVEQRIDADGLGRFVFICMELIKSRLELSDVIESRRNAGKKFRVDEVLHIVRKLLDALIYAHEHTIHRDIKPGNIMLVPHVEQAEIDTSDLTKFDIRLIDFGIAKVLSQKHIDVTGKGFRSAHYGAPELADVKAAVDARADIFSAGVIMYQMLTKNIPRKGSPPANKVNKEVPAALARVIDKAINADREKRFKTVSEFTKEIDRAVSKFNWLLKPAKIAAVLLIGLCIAWAVKYFLPEPDYVPLQQNIDILKNRNPDKQIAAFYGGEDVRLSDIEGYNSYESLRQAALGDLQKVQLAGLNKFKRSFPPWKAQETLWVELESSVEKVESIAEDQREYNARKDLPIASHLMKLEPSSQIVSEVKDKTNQAESFLETRPLSLDALDFCADTYDLSAQVYTNIDVLADGSETLDAAEQINDKLKSVEKMRNSYLPTRDSLDVIEQLKRHGFYERSEKCFEKADRYRKSFALESAEKYFTLLNQICGTMTNVKGQIDFVRSDMGLISSRLMELCYENIETFDNYPAWTERLDQVYKRKNILAKYTSIQALLSRSPEGTPMEVYDLAESALKQFEQGNVDSADTKLNDSMKHYKRFMHQKINDLMRDCYSLLTFPSVSAESIQSCKNSLEKLSVFIDGPAWPDSDFAEEFNSCSEKIATEKNAAREQLILQARNLKKEIVNSSLKAQQQSFFWKSQLITRYANIAQRYDRDDIDFSIEKWKYVEDLGRLPAIINQMTTISSLLEKMLARKDQLDRLADDIDKGITFCKEFIGISSEEKEKYKQFGLALEQLRSKLLTPLNKTYLIDQADEIFTPEYESILSVFSEIRSQLPYHSSRVTGLINNSHILEKNADSINNLQKLWADFLTELSVSEIELDFNRTRLYLESVKTDVDEWSHDSFNQQMEDKCKILADTLDQQSRVVTNVASLVLAEKSRLIKEIEAFEKRVNEILRDEDIRTLDDIAAADSRRTLLRFRGLPTQLASAKLKFRNIMLSDGTGSLDVITEETSLEFEIDTWFVRFNNKKGQLAARISQLRAIEDTIPAFQQTRLMLNQQSSIETDYYLALRDCAISSIDYSNIRDKMDTLEADSVVVKMCQFLEQMNDETAPRLEKIKAGVNAVGRELTELKSEKISTLAEAKGFNQKREQLLDRIATLRQDVVKLDRVNLEKSCKDRVTVAVDQITNLVGYPAQAEVLSKLTSSLWAFYPDHKDWGQWAEFLALYHINVSDEELWLASSSLLSPVNEQGDYLSLSEIAANPTKAFYISSDSPANFGWPRYISHQKDPSVILAFIPATSSAGTEPFYIAIREISNAQYKMFLEESGAQPTTNLAGWAYFADSDNNLLIGQAQGQFPPSRITWDKSANTFILDEEFKHNPVTWVTYYGGQTYAQWLDARLPTVSQHAYAARAGSSTLYPWGDDLSNAASYAHVRSSIWQNAARQYNVKRDDPVQIAYPPIGAVKDFLTGKALDPSKIIHTSFEELSVWPCLTKNRPNAWGLYDMLGNVWEWCIDLESDSAPTICGGSCLCPPEYISPESKYEFRTQACDVGFRVVMPAQ